jgi:hypothetical protein
MGRDVRMGPIALHRQAEAIADLFAGAWMRIYDGQRPEGPEDAPVGSTLLVELRFPGADQIRCSDALITCGALEASPARASGRPRWYRIVSPGPPTVTILDGYCGEKGSGKSCELAHLRIDQGQLCSCSSYVHDVGNDRSDDRRGEE